MSSTLETATDFRPFEVEVPNEELADLRRRIAATNELRAAFRSLPMNGGHA